MTDTVEKKQPIFSVRPVFDTRIATAQALLFGAAGTLVVTLVGGTFLLILLSLIGISRFIPLGYMYGFLFVAGVVILPAYFYETKKKAYAATVAHFFGSHVDYQFFQHYITRKRGRLYYRDVEQVSQRANFFQEQSHLTTITLYVDDPQYRNAIVPALKLNDVSQTQDFLGVINDLVEKDRAPVIAESVVTG